MYIQAVNGIRAELITKTDQGLTYVAELLGKRKSPKMVGPLLAYLLACLLACIRWNSDNLLGV